MYCYNCSAIYPCRDCRLARAEAALAKAEAEAALAKARAEAALAKAALAKASLRSTPTPPPISGEASLALLGGIALAGGIIAACSGGEHSRRRR